MSDRKRAFLAWLGVATGLVSVVLLPAFGARWLLLRFALSSPWKEKAIAWTAMLVGGVGGFLLFSEASWAWVRWRRGWRVQRIANQRYAYEEFDDSGRLRSFEVRYEALEERYAPPCQITVPAAADWNRMLPSWAHDRRDAILERLRLWGACEGWNAPVTFVDATALSNEAHG